MIMASFGTERLGVWLVTSWSPSCSVRFLPVLAPSKPHKPTTTSPCLYHRSASVFFRLRSFGSAQHAAWAESRGSRWARYIKQGFGRHEARGRCRGSESEADSNVPMRIQKVADEVTLHEPWKGNMSTASDKRKWCSLQVLR